MNCNICKKHIRSGSHMYDAKVKGGGWAYMCTECFRKLGVGLGTGKGQKYRVGKGESLTKLEG